MKYLSFKYVNIYSFIIQFNKDKLIDTSSCKIAFIYNVLKKVAGN